VRSPGGTTSIRECVPNVSASESIVLRCACRNDDSSNGVNPGCPGGSRRCSWVIRLVVVPVTAISPATHSALVSSPFHSAPSAPPGRSTRAISVRALSWSNQWNA
jgi:hypothetical protein